MKVNQKANIKQNFANVWPTSAELFNEFTIGPHFDQTKPDSSTILLADENT